MCFAPGTINKAVLINRVDMVQTTLQLEAEAAYYYSADRSPSQQY